MRKLLLVFSCLRATVPAIQAEEHDRGERANQSWNRGRYGDDHRDRDDRSYRRDRDDHYYRGDRDDRRYFETRSYRSYPSYGVQSYAPPYYRRDADFDFRPNGYLNRAMVSQFRPYNDGGFYVPEGARCGVYGGRVIVYDPISMLILNVLSLAR